MGRLKKMTLKKTFYITVFLTVIGVILLSVVAVGICTKVYNRILASHAFVMEPTEDSKKEEDTSYSYGYTIEPDESAVKEYQSQYSKNELLICRLMEILMVLFPVAFSVFGIVCAGSIFYNVKLKKPLIDLKMGINHIADNDLDFSIKYQKQDELGMLCIAFETMRKELIKNNRYMWNMVEERKKINASISHDLRTPITVIKGYSEFLENNVGKEILTEDGIREIAQSVHQAAGRLENYANSVHEVQTLEDARMDYQKVLLSDMGEEIRFQFSVLGEQQQKKIKIHSYLPKQCVMLSSDAIFRILENVVANALRYCKEIINIEIFFNEPIIKIVVSDDGKGFSEQDLTCAMNYFYKDKSEEGHFGIGLTICKILAEKHGGSILLDNLPEGGARVTVQIATKEEISIL